MSQWTHVNGSFRIDGLGYTSDADIYKVFGEEVGYHDTSFAGCGSSGKTLPCGSEGSLNMSIWRNPDSRCLASFTVNVFGDLRDYGGGDIDSLVSWFDEICNKMWIRQAVLEINDEYSDDIVVLVHTRAGTSKLRCPKSDV